jgi:hypothetical protein
MPCNSAAEEETGHELRYSDMHIGRAAELAMTVRYTCEPFAVTSTPQPTTMALLGIGLAAIGQQLARRRDLPEVLRRDVPELVRAPGVRGGLPAHRALIDARGGDDVGGVPAGRDHRVRR